jgi:hypothetical protein
MRLVLPVGLVTGRNHAIGMDNETEGAGRVEVRRFPRRWQPELHAGS